MFPFIWHVFYSTLLYEVTKSLNGPLNRKDLERFYMEEWSNILPYFHQS